MPPSPNHIRIKNASLLILIMLVGLYFALGAIFSLSYIKEAPSDKDSIIARFDTAFLHPVTTYDMNFKNLSSAGSASDVKNIGYEITHLITMKADSSLMHANPATRKRLELAIDEAIDTLSRHLSNLTLQGELVFEQYQAGEQKLKNLYASGNSKFHGAVNKLSAGLLNQFGQDWITYLSDFETLIASNLYHNMSNFDAASVSLSRIVNNTIVNTDIVIKAVKAKDSLSGFATGNIINFRFLPSQNLYKVDIPDSVVMSKLEVPTQGALGQEWGKIFPNFISPIAGSKSVDILLVFGMIGFALFGAAIAVFITGSNLADEATGTNLLLVIVRGFSAAIVVYLATRAGIAVVNNGTSDPNPLVLFLFCFIGAVFSERIWGWARSKIQDTFPEKQQKLNEVVDNTD